MKIVDFETTPFSDFKLSPLGFSSHPELATQLATGKQG